MTFGENIDYWRQQASIIWHDFQENPIFTENSFILPSNIPPYFIDRYAYGLYHHHIYGELLPIPLDSYFALNKHIKWEDNLKNFLKSHHKDLPFPPKSLEEKILDLDFMEELFYLWRKFLNGFGIAVPNELFKSPSGNTWQNFFRDSLHYPNLPAINGPTFYTRMTEVDKKTLNQHFGLLGPLGLYIFLLQVHEQSHFLQRGETILCELTLACLWCRFLSEHNLWYWQENSTTRVSFNMERLWVESLNFDDQILALLFSDTWLACQVIFSNRASYVYEEICLTAWRFNAKQLRYQSCLKRITYLLQGGTE